MPVEGQGLEDEHLVWKNLLFDMTPRPGIIPAWWVWDEQPEETTRHDVMKERDDGAR